MQFLAYRNFSACMIAVASLNTVEYVDCQDAL